MGHRTWIAQGSPSLHHVHVAADSRQADRTSHSGKTRQDSLQLLLHALFRYPVVNPAVKTVLLIAFQYYPARTHYSILFDDIWCIFVVQAGYSHGAELAFFPRLASLGVPQDAATGLGGVHGHCGSAMNCVTSDVMRHGFAHAWRSETWFSRF